ncbi:MAG TPA: serine/threonine-protein kinase [Gemmatimonadales bacterium]|nr:serine/threonine-protein kinase [Gemmatimonadales bacterium]
MVDVLGALREGLAPHYSVEREIGAGGMARVFLAAERHPPRKVAVKVMNPEVAGSEFRERFIREVELTSRLSHPHIVPILAADECLFVPDGPDGLCYYVMPYIEGESLRARLEREQRLPLDEAVRIALEVGDALSYAHGQGIIHRDIKPENILLSGDHAWVADFGIARAVSAAGGHSLTGGNAVGSLAYMSPEQLMGSRAIDARTDVYSLGGVFYEMLVGEPPLLRLAGKTPHGGAALDAALRAQRVSHRSERVVKEIITRALAPEPDDRFVSVDEFVARLRDVLGRGLRLPRVRWKAVLLLGAAATAIGVVGAAILGRRAPALDPRRVVVAGFEDLSGDSTLAPLGRIAADWVTQALAGRGGLEVVRGAATGHLDAAEIRALAAQTGAGTVVSGSYYRDGDSVRFHVQIIDAARGTVRRGVEPIGAPRRAPTEAAEAVRHRLTAVFDTLFPPAKR